MSQRPIIFPESKKEYSAGVFETPGNEYRSAPFWGWNGKLERGELLRQIEVFKKMGYGGFHMHARQGLDTEYLGEEFMEYVRACCQKAEAEGMKAYLYDEDKYPSGNCGGRVTENPAFTRRYLRVTPFAYDDAPDAGVPDPVRGFAPIPGSEEIARYRVELDERGCLAAYERLSADAPKPERGRLWHVYFEKQAPSTVLKKAYVDTMNPKAISEFARIGYEPYAKAVSEYFGGVSPSIFTDEPQYARLSHLNFAADLADVILPWTDTFAETYKETYGEDILDMLPELVFNLPDGKLSRARYRYHDHKAERFVAAFCDTLGDWCDAHGLLFNGHVMSEDTLGGQTEACGEAMRCYRAFGVPGIDVLGGYKYALPTAKQGQSAARQQGSAAFMSELYGVQGWDYDLRSFKLQGDWQAAMGVTLRVPHHSWYSMASTSKRDYPLSLNYHSPWFEEMKLIEDHFARLNTALTRGKADVKIGILHPIESYWMHYGPGDQSGPAMAQLEESFSGVVTGLSRALIDFDLISEARLPQLCAEGGNPLQVGEMAYSTVIVPGLVTMRRSTLERLAAFKAAGGRVVFMGGCPEYVDGMECGDVRALFAGCEQLGMSVSSLVDALAPERDVDVRLPSGSRAGHVLHQLRDDGDARWLFFCNARHMETPDVDIPSQHGLKYTIGRKFVTETLRFRVRGEWKLTLCDTMTGKTEPLPANYRGGWTEFDRVFYMQDSLLLRMEAGRLEAPAIAAAQAAAPAERRFAGFFPVTLDEPNAFILDMAEYALDDEALRPTEELLRLDDACRRRVGLPLRLFSRPQPYQIEYKKPEHSIRLRFTFHSDVAVAAPKLALECPEEAQLTLNGAPVDSSKPDGWYVDIAIKTIALPPIAVGENVLEAVIPLGPRTNLEYMYLLGDFGVAVAGTEKRITAPVRCLAFGDWTTQGLPFYGGSVTYHMNFTVGGGFTLRVPHYRGALVRVSADGVDRGAIVCSPYSIDLGDLTAGEHAIDLKLYGNRQNSFGPLHHLSSFYYSQGPDAWRSTGDLWNYEYGFMPKGIMSSPRVYENNAAPEADQPTLAKGEIIA